MNLEQIAMVCHEANRAYCLTLGDASQPIWDDAPEWQRDSARNGVKFHLANPNSTQSQSHAEWLKQKKAEGWKYGAVKDSEKKEHPCFVPYSELPAEQKAKDALFVGVIRALEPMHAPENSTPIRD